MADKLYEHLYDPTKKFIEELRAFCYDLSQKLISQLPRRKRRGFLA